MAGADRDWSDAGLRARFEGLDRPRPLPPAVRANLASALSEPAPLPEVVRDRVAASMLAEAAEPASLSTRLAGIDGPRPLPPGLRDTLEGALRTAGGHGGGGGSTATAPAAGAPSGPSWWRRRRAALVATAAAVVVALIALQPGDRSGERVAAPGPAGSASGAGGSAAFGGGGVGVPASGQTGTGGGSTLSPPGDQSGGATPARPGLGSTGSAGSPAGVASSTGAYPAPPFTWSEATAASPATVLPLGGSSTTTAPPPARAPVSVAVSGDDSVARRAFAAYVERLNAAGGAGGRTFAVSELPDAGADGLRSPGDAAVVVNLEPEPLGPAVVPDGTVVLETVATPAGDLTGTVFSFAGAIDRQAAVAVDRLVPANARGATAVVFRERTGVYSSVVPDTIEQRLRERGVTVIPVRWDPAAPVMPPANFAFVALGPSAASWAAAADEADYRLGRGVAGLAAFADPAHLGPEGMVVVSPYQLEGGPGEHAALSEAVGGPVSAEAVHGWVTAKMLAIAVWRSGAGDAASMATALGALDDHPTNFSPYRRRENGNVRQPDAVVLTVSAGTLAARGDFVDAR